MTGLIYLFIIIKRKTVIIMAVILLILLSLAVFKLDRLFYPYPYQQIVEKYASLNGVDPCLVISVIREESRFKAKSISPKGAVGLMQIMPGTAEEISAWLGENYEDIDLTRPEDNIRYGCWYLAALSKEYSGNTVLTLAAYNAGIGRVNGWLGSVSGDLNSFLIEDIPFKETREYVQKVFASYQKYKKLYYQSR
jgi:soluble lytic murein transglycosylase